MDSRCIEFVVYTSPSAEFASTQKKAMDIIRSFDGFIDVVILTGQDQDNALATAELIIWSSLEKALAAAQRFYETPMLVAFLEAIAVRYFGHYQFMSDQQWSLLKSSSRATIIADAEAGEEEEALLDCLLPCVHKADSDAFVSPSQVRLLAYQEPPSDTDLQGVEWFRVQAHH